VQRQIHPACILIVFTIVLQTMSSAQVTPSDAAYRSSWHAAEAGRAAQWVTYHAEQARVQPQRSEFAALAWQWKAYETQQIQWAAYYQQLGNQTAMLPAGIAAPSTGLPPITLRGGLAYGLNSLPLMVHRVIWAANSLQNKPYLLGGGHHRLEDRGYDCSSATCYVLIKAGLLQGMLNSSRLAEYGEPGQGRYVTLWVKPGQHVFITICGLRLDTSGGRVREGPRWRTADRSIVGFIPRHPPGL
jgi:hypothetical protein